MEGKGMGPFRLAPWFSPRVWGRQNLRPWYASTGTTELVGEAWLTGPECVVETGALAGRTLASVVAERGEEILGTAAASGGICEFPLLVKMLFPNEKLSVQVHPDDVHAQAMGQPRGKTECWYVLEAEPGAAVALGLKDGVTVAALGDSVASGTMEELLEWVPVSVGDMIFVDAGTVHAIGPGVVLLETQQTCDVTFRLYDYGRPRELHLEQGLKVMKTETAAGKVKPVEMDALGGGFRRLIEQRYFVVDRYEVGAGSEAVVPLEGPGCLVGLKGSGVVTCEGSDAVELVAGRAVVVPMGLGPVVVESEAGASFVRCFEP